MKTKSEILNPLLDDTTDNHTKIASEQDALNAMEEYANNQMTAFENWIKEQGYHPNGIKAVRKFWKKWRRVKCYTTQELLTMFKYSQKK